MACSLTYLEDIWLDTTIVSGTWDTESKHWILNVRRGGKPCRVTCSHLVFATGAGGAIPVLPEYENRVGRLLATVTYEG